MTVLTLSSVRVDRAGFAIVRDIDLLVRGGEVTVLLGPNGAGKTTLLEGISGIVPIGGGSVTLDAHDLTGASRRSRARAGLGHVEQGRAVFSDLTVAENLRAVPGVDAADPVLELFPELRSRLGVPAGSISGGEQQMLVIGRALAGRPKILLIDELSLGLAPVIVKRLMPIVRRLADEGLGVLLVEQYAAQALAIADHAYVLNRGAMAFAGPARELRERGDLLRQAYLGVDLMPLSSRRAP